MAVISKPRHQLRRKGGRTSKLPLAVALTVFVVFAWFWSGPAEPVQEEVLQSRSAQAPPSGTGLVSSGVTKRPRTAHTYTTVQPIQCSPLLEQEYQTNEDWGQLMLRYTKPLPRFWVSLHPPEFDPVRWSVMSYGKYYEFGLTEAFASVLRSSKAQQPHVIDVGGNIGWFSMFSMANGARVYTFEPNKANHYRACETICLNDWDDEPCHVLGPIMAPTTAAKNVGQVEIFPIGIGATNDILTFRIDEKNPGTSKISHGKVTGKSELMREIQVMPLDYLRVDMGWDKVDIDILKVDVEGLERDVFRGAVELLKSGRVKNIFMEGNVARHQVKDFRETIAQLTGDGYKLYRLGGFEGPSGEYVAPEGVDATEGIVQKCSTSARGKHRNQCNIWWKLDK